MVETFKAETPTLVSELMGLVVPVQDNYGFFSVASVEISHPVALWEVW